MSETFAHDLSWGGVTFCHVAPPFRRRHRLRCDKYISPGRSAAAYFPHPDERCRRVDRNRRGRHGIHGASIWRSSAPRQGRRALIASACLIVTMMTTRRPARRALPAVGTGEFSLTAGYGLPRAEGFQAALAAALRAAGHDGDDHRRRGVRRYLGGRTGPAGLGAGRRRRRRDRRTGRQ